MSRRNRPSAVDFWPSRPAYASSNPDTPDIDEAPAPAPPQPALLQRNVDEEDEEEDEDDTSDSIERPSRNKDLNPTCVTPLIATLANSIYRDLRVAGTLTESIDKIKKNSLISSAEYIDFMDRLLELVHSKPFDPLFDDRFRLNRRSHRILDTYYNEVTVNTIRYRIGDVVIVPADADGRHPAPDFPDNAPRARPFTFAGYLFWFGRILSIKSDSRTAHVQWLEHASRTIMDELAHPQELFLTETCGDVDLSTFLAKCRCTRVAPGERQERRGIDHTEFFYCFTYDQVNGVFRDISEAEEDPNKFAQTFGTCGLCTKREEDLRRKSEDCLRIPYNDEEQLVGFERSGVAYHCDDIILFRLDINCPCQIGKITGIYEEVEGFTIVVQPFGRVNDVVRSRTDMVACQYDERHLFLTRETLRISSDVLAGKAFLLHKRAASSFRLRGWLDASENHFYITKTAPIDRESREDLEPLAVQDFVLCRVCTEEEIDKTYDFLVWRESARAHPLRVFDPFAGCGAFVLGMCETGSMKFTHAIDISPSATETLRINSPGTLVYNQCSNKMLEYAVAKMNGSNMVLTDLLNDEELPEPLRREDIDCIVSGFPCQPHSALNMFQRAHDLLNELFLNTVSWVEHLRPKYCLFENVSGFVHHRIGAAQKDHYTVQGGIELGGVKFVCRALTALGYQVRFAICQAAHYGTPQSRERFFLWAARSGLPLPEFPPPTHYFRITSSLSIKCSNGDVINPIGNVFVPPPLPFVTVADAISDLKRWDWVNPHKVYPRNAQARREEVDRENQHIEQVRSHYGDAFCGIGGAEYEHEPRSAFQAWCRRRKAEELQHITPCFDDAVIERTCNIPVEVGANYKNLNNMPGLWEWQTINPSSANARHGYKDTMYRRLEADEFFPTTVTNVHPTAQQSRVLNPWCKRMVTVRELARSQGFPDDFKFEAVDRKVKTMHRLIGNAVPWQMSEALGRELERVYYKETKEPDVMDVD